MIKRSKTFKGGYIFQRYLSNPLDTLLEQGIPEKVIIPLAQGFGSEVKLLVKKGDKVSAGQIIGRDDENVSSPVHSSVFGTVEEIKRMNYFKRELEMVVIRADKTQKDYLRVEGFNPDWAKLRQEELEKILYLSGVTALDREGIPTRFKSSVIPPSGVENIIVHGVGSEPYNISLELLLNGKKILNLIDGLRILNTIMPGANMYLALNSRKQKLLEEINKIAVKYKWLKVVPLEPKYPQGYDEMLIPTLLNQRFPYGYSAANIGVVVLNIQAVLSVYEAVCEGKPLIERIIALCGPGLKEPLHVKARIGTPLGEIITPRLNEKLKSRIVLNSLMTGVKLNDLTLPISRTFSHLIAIPEGDKREFLAFMRPGLRQQSYSHTFASSLLPFFNKTADTNLHGEERPCISCSYCEEVCPVGIIPHLLSKYIKRNMIDETLMNYNIFNCIECGLCTFVCPSKIPLLQHLKEGKDKLTMQGCDHAQCILPYFDMKGIEEYRGVTKL
ncbi:MAG: 4Fe-4S dicluster domain-containing protein [Candidatus Omnitrophota bacterium]